MRPWFLAIVANQCRTIVRGRWWSVLRIEPRAGAAAGFEDQIVRGADLRAALRKLAPEHREALVLHYYLDLPLYEIAAIAGVPIGTVKSRINRGIAAMRPFFYTDGGFHLVDELIRDRMHDALDAEPAPAGLRARVIGSVPIRDRTQRGPQPPRFRWVGPFATGFVAAVLAVAVIAGLLYSRHAISSPNQGGGSHPNHHRG